MVRFPDRRRTAVAVLVAVAVATGTLLVPVLSSHIAVARSDRIGVAAPDASVLDGGDRVEVTLRVDNPTPRAVRVPEQPSASGIVLFADGEGNPGDRITDSRGVEISGATVPAGGTATLTLTLDVVGEYRPIDRESVLGNDLGGSLPIEIAGFETTVGLNATVGAA
ncbi:hypothetical protein Hbl1158_11085 [Halobaculum sp. CBA1158]|uniref:hypothetical protein n=1 Tax=Halobaculum sp. CBA1158 TaxID=2904243 RepID=UPI001F37A6A0|nr:hypothetical protein [Halobaculum sp. CBA1158]UIO99074.1 hypothetical protein Hbl1158_11085 [Halobaculum sp. CBA1158]